MSIEPGSPWAVEAAGRRLEWREADLTFAVRCGKETWEVSGPAAESLRCRTGAGHDLSVNDATRRLTRSFRNGALEGIVCELSQFRNLPPGPALRLHLVVAIEVATGDVVAWVDGREEGLTFESLRWPGPIVLRGVASEETMMPFSQGVLIRGNWPKAFNERAHLCHTRGLYMPWWGHRRGDAVCVTIIESDADGGCWFRHPAGGPTSVGPYWAGSLGRISYARRVRYSFLERGDYVSACKLYRAHVRRQGRFVSLAQKMQAAPKVRTLIGAPVVHAGIAYTIHPMSHYYHKDAPEKNHGCVPFAERARQLRALHGRGVRNVYLHLDGWGVAGYDSHHPDTLPPNEEAGGWDGLRGLADTCHELDYLIALHDQYRDYFHSAPSYDPENAVLDGEGKAPYNDMWYGGPQSVLCATLAPAYVLRNHVELARNGVPVDGTYLDVFAIHEGDECHHPAHRVTRAECLARRAECFAIIRELEGIVSSEEPVDYAVPHLHLVHHGPYPMLSWQTGSEGQAVLAPLFNLVYHDAIILPWRLGAESPFEPLRAAHAALNAGMPYIGIAPDDAQIARVARMCELHRRVATEEMVSHRFLDETQTRQQTVFADGAIVTADVSTGEWEM